jgi:hypothetical protein
MSYPVIPKVLAYVTRRCEGSVEVLALHTSGAIFGRGGRFGTICSSGSSVLALAQERR